MDKGAALDAATAFKVMIDQMERDITTICVCVECVHFGMCVCVCVFNVCVRDRVCIFDGGEVVFDVFYCSFSGLSGRHFFQKYIEHNFWDNRCVWENLKSNYYKVTNQSYAEPIAKHMYDNSARIQVQ